MNVLQQIQNLKSDALVRQKVDEGSLQLHALWFNISDGEMHMFSREEKRFIAITEKTVRTVFSGVA